MKMLNNEELLSIKGGGLSSKLLWGIIGGLVVFCFGIVDGIINPKKCN